MEQNTTITKATAIENEVVANVNSSKETVKNAISEIDKAIASLKASKEKIIECAKSFSNLFDEPKTSEVINNGSTTNE